MPVLTLEPLNTAAFAPFGDVINIVGEPSFPINAGTTARYHDLGAIDVLGGSAHAAISMARGQGFSLPMALRLLERHPLGSQAWLPRGKTPFVVVVAPNSADDRPDMRQLRAFYAQGGQGVNYHAGTWHHPLLTHDEEGQSGDFYVVDRIGTEANCDEVVLTGDWTVAGPCPNGE